jgi:regulator of protease activity HflC (stomatin/prohibitin superfamily)
VPELSRYWPWVLVIGVIIAFVIEGVRMVPQQSAWVVERLGRFHGVLQPGLNLIIPFLDRVRCASRRTTRSSGSTAFSTTSGDFAARREQQISAEREKRALIAKSERERQQETVAGVRAVAEAIADKGGMDAANLKVAQQ